MSTHPREAGTDEGVSIPPFERDDAPAVVALLRELEPNWITTVPGLLHGIDSSPPRARRRHWVAVEDGAVVGWCSARFHWGVETGDVAGFSIGVRKDHRRRGMGSALYDLAEAHLVECGARKLESWAEKESGKRFLEARGFRPSRSERLWSLDPRTVDLSELPELERKRAEEGFRVVPLRALEHRMEDVYPLWAEAVADVPADEPETNISLEEWKEGELKHPDLSYDGSFVVLQDGRPVSLAWLVVDHKAGKAEHEFTGTARDFRRRGLARLVKLAAIRWAAENGITAIMTGNDSTNADMLALNEHLGYRPLDPQTRYVKTL